MNNRYSGCSAVGSASGLGPGGRRFESCHPDKNLSKFYGFERFFLSCLLCLFGCLIPIRMHTSEGILMLRETVMLERNEASKYQAKFKTEEQKNIRRYKVIDFSSLRSVEMTKQRFVIPSVGEKSLNCVPWCILPLDCCRVFYLLSFYHVLLVPKKMKRPSTRAFESRVSRLVNCVGKQYNSFDTRLPLQACLSVTGCCGS